MRYRPLADRYWEKVEKRGPDECWPWTGATYGGGYGTIRLGADYENGNLRTVGAHRVSWFLSTGEWPPDDKEVCHSCDNPGCQNPAHHFIGTHKQNMDDRERKGRGGNRGAPKGQPRPAIAGDLNWTRRMPERVLKGAEHPCAKLTDDKVREIRRRLIDEAGHGIKAKLGREYGVDEVTIGYIGKGKIWKHILPATG